MGEFQAYTYDGFRELNAKLLTGEDIAPVREQNREAQGLYAMVSIRDEAGRSHGYMAVVLSMDATIQAERDFLTHIICVLLLITAALAVLSILTAQHILIKPVNQLTDASVSVAAAGGSMEVLKIVAYRDSHHIPTWALVAKRLSSSDYFYPDGSPFCYLSRSSSNGNRSACLRHKQACSNKTPPLVFAHGFGHKKERLSIPNAGQIDALCT